MKTKNPKDIKVADKVILVETGFEYVVMIKTTQAIKIQRGETIYWIPLSIISIFESLLSVSGYRLFKFKVLPEWFVTKNNIH